MYFTPSVKIKLFWLLYCYFILKNFQNLVIFKTISKEGIVAETKARVVLRNKSLKYNCGKGKWAQISIWASLTTKSFLLSMIFCGFFCEGKMLFYFTNEANIKTHLTTDCKRST